MCIHRVYYITQFYSLPAASRAKRTIRSEWTWRVDLPGTSESTQVCGPRLPPLPPVSVQAVHHSFIHSSPHRYAAGRLNPRVSQSALLTANVYQVKPYDQTVTNKRASVSQALLQRKKMSRLFCEISSQGCLFTPRLS